MKKEIDIKQWQHLFEAYKESSIQFDKNILYISAGALGLSMTFIKDIVPLNEALYVSLLIIAWSIFTLIIFASLLSYYLSMKATKYCTFNLVDSNSIFSNSLGIVASDNLAFFATLNSFLHNEWAWKYGSRLETRLRYSSNEIFYNFPFISNDFLKNFGIELLNSRKITLQKLKLGITKTYNLLHNNAITILAFNERDKQVSGLIKHLENTPNSISIEEAIQGIIKLRELHKALDEAVLEAYGWNQDDPKWGKAIQLRHDFYEVDYLPENDRVRYTIHPEARKEVLKRLLQLNHERYAEEVAAGLHDKKKPTKKKVKVKKGKKDKEDVDDGRTQKVLFPEVDLFNQENEAGNEN